MYLQSLTNEKLQTRLTRLARHERKVMALVIEHIAEVQRRKLFLTLGYDSLYHYLTKELHYSEGSAYRRMQAARALLQVPEIKSSLENGSLKLSQICLVQKTLRQEEKNLGKQVPLTKRHEIFAQLKGKNGRESEKILEAQVSVVLPQKLSSERHCRDDSVELTLQVSPALFAKLQRVKELYSHIDPAADWVRLLALMADDVIKKRDPLAKKRAGKETVMQSFAKMKKPIAIEESNMRKRRSIPRAVKRYILKRDDGKCQYVSTDGRKCESRHRIEVDHMKPVCEGGNNESQNLRVLCRQHNDFRNIEQIHEQSLLPWTERHQLHDTGQKWR